MGLEVLPVDDNIVKVQNARYPPQIFFCRNKR